MTTTEVWKNYADDVKRLIMSKVKDTQITDDLVQEVFIKAHTKLETVLVRHPFNANSNNEI